MGERDNRGVGGDGETKSCSWSEPTRERTIQDHGQVLAHGLCYPSRQVTLETQSFTPPREPACCQHGGCRGLLPENQTC